jgi:hypothetical protein
MDGKKYTSTSGHFHCHSNALVHVSAHCLIEKVEGFTQSHWMPPLSKYTLCIAPMAALVINFG